MRGCIGLGQQRAVYWTLYTRGGNKGIDIASNFAAPVRAAAAGTVVYSGNGIPGYGKLIIIKHNANYLSAYAYNSRLTVSKGKRVKLGEKIAEIGYSGGNQAELHFEIRRRGRPVDPQRYLPRLYG